MKIVDPFVWLFSKRISAIFQNKNNLLEIWPGNTPHIGLDGNIFIENRNEFKRLYSTSQLVEFDSENLRFNLSDNTVDGVISYCGLNFLEDDDWFFEECSRVLKSGAKLAIVIRTSKNFNHYDSFKGYIRGLTPEYVISKAQASNLNFEYIAYSRQIIPTILINAISTFISNIIPQVFSIGLLSDLSIFLEEVFSKHRHSDKVNKSEAYHVSLLFSKL